MPFSANAATDISFKNKECELSDIFRRYGDSFKSKHKIPSYHSRIMNNIEYCRTEHFGGRVDKCDKCGFLRESYNSCRNRHCPKCQTYTKEKWLEARKAELLPIGYFHNVFTLPHDLNPLASYNKKVIYNLLFKSAAQALLIFGLDPKQLGGKLGFTAILHTWDQLLNSHIHLHVIIPSGALSSGKDKWLPVRKSKKKKKYLFNVIALSLVFRGIFIEDLEKSFRKGKLIFKGKIGHLKTKEEFKKLVKTLWKPKWVVYSKEPFASPEHVFNYLGRYTHKVAISNYRIISMENKMVTFKYRDRRDGDKEKIISIPVEEFIARFMSHILPKRFMRIRHFGFLSNRYKKKNIEKIRQLLKCSDSLSGDTDESTVDKVKSLVGVDLISCPKCKKGEMVLFKESSPVARIRLKDKTFIDTS